MEERSLNLTAERGENIPDSKVAEERWKIYKWG